MGVDYVLEDWSFKRGIIILTYIEVVNSQPSVVVQM